MLMTSCNIDVFLLSVLLIFFWLFLWFDFFWGKKQNDHHHYKWKKKKNLWKTKIDTNKPNSETEVAESKAKWWGRRKNYTNTNDFHFFLWWCSIKFFSRYKHKSEKSQTNTRKIFFAPLYPASFVFPIFIKRTLSDSTTTHKKFRVGYFFLCSYWIFAKLKIFIWETKNISFSKLEWKKRDNFSLRSCRYWEKKLPMNHNQDKKKNLIQLPKKQAQPKFC